MVDASKQELSGVFFHAFVFFLKSDSCSNRKNDYSPQHCNSKLQYLYHRSDIYQYFFFDTFTTQKVEVYFSFWAFTNRLVRKPPSGPQKTNIIVREGTSFTIVLRNNMLIRSFSQVIGRRYRLLYFQYDKRVERLCAS